MTRNRTQQTAAVVAGATGVALVVVGAFFGPSGRGGAHTVRSAGPTTSAPTTSTTRRADTTTRPALLTTTTTAPPVVVPPPTTPPGATPGGGSTESLGVDPPPTSPPPDGLQAAGDPATCTWDSADGGTLRASGTLTNAANPGDTWLVAVDWNDDEGFLDNESDFFTAAPGQSTQWSLTVAGADPPTGTLTCAVQVT